MNSLYLKAVAISSVLLAGCMPDRPAPVLAFNQGDIVQSVVSNQRGQVVWVRCFKATASCYYDVRFADMSIATYMHEYEISALK